MSRFKRQLKQQPKADAILSADWHIRPDTPVCRIDNYWIAQEGKIDFILALRKEHDCPLLIAGDLGKYPLNNGWPTWLSRWAIKKLRGHHTIAVPGQHDLPSHKLDLWHKSGIGVLEAANVIEVAGVLGTSGWGHSHQEGLDEIELCHFPLKSTIEKFMIIPFPYSTEIKSLNWAGFEKPTVPMIAIVHQMVIENKPLWPDQKAPRGHQLLKKFPEYDLILTGDNHNAFVAKYEGRVLVNPGSMMRTTADQVDHKPRVYLWYAESNEVVPVYLPIEQGVISREHIEVEEARQDRFAALIERVKNDVEIQLSYEDNLQKYFEKYRTEKLVKEKTWRAVG